MSSMSEKLGEVGGSWEKLGERPRGPDGETTPLGIRAVRMETTMPAMRAVRMETTIPGIRAVRMETTPSGIRASWGKLGEVRGSSGKLGEVGKSWEYTVTDAHRDGRTPYYSSLRNVSIFG